MTERFWELLARYWSGDISAEEKAELERLLLEHPDHWLKAGVADQLAYRSSSLLSDQEIENLSDKILGRVNEEGQEEKGDTYEMEEEPIRRRRKWMRPLAAVAVSALILAGVLIYSHPTPHPSAISWKNITTAPGTKTSVILADGSSVWLNAGSTLRYREDFNEKSREVYLSGEAYFIVKHDAAKPFIIHTARMEVKDIGTEFDVRAYPDEDFSETSLIKGAVEVGIQEGDSMQQVLLKPGQKVVINNKEPVKNEAEKGSGQKATTGTDTLYDNVTLKELRPFEGIKVPEIAWKEDQLIFNNETFESLIMRLERWYGVKIIIQDPELMQQRFTGRADNVSLEKLLSILQTISPFTYSRKGEELIIQ